MEKSKFIVQLLLTDSFLQQISQGLCARGQFKTLDPTRNQKTDSIPPLVERLITQSTDFFKSTGIDDQQPFLH